MDLSDIDLARRSLALFGHTGALRKVATGLDSTYRVKTAGGRVFALRIASGIPFRRASAFAVEAEWIDALANNPWFDIPRVQRTENGQLAGRILDADGNARASTLLSWLPGRRRFQPNPTNARLLGRATGALHLHAQTAGPPPVGAIKAWDAKLMCLMPKRTEEALGRIAPEGVEPVQRIFAGLQRTVAKLNSTEMGLINADLGLHNVLWHKGQIGLVDFNDSGVGPYAFCLARLVARIRLHQQDQALIDELLRGYREVTPLPCVYEQWGDLFELAADAFSLNYGAGRALRRGVSLREHEQRIMHTLDERLKRLDL
ncbi:MAG: phosphotransferase [Candidatus Latescibacteria bacterium]|nr:phosphotransferase [Candidatus Latescibacterota bacterium]